MSCFTRLISSSAVLTSARGPTARSDEGRADAEELLLHEVKGAHAAFRPSEDERAFGRGEEHPCEVGRLRLVNAGGFGQFRKVRDPDLEDLSRGGPGRFGLPPYCSA